MVGREKRKTKNRAGVALRLAAGTLLQSDTYLGAQYRRLRTKLGAPKARKAMANKLARIIYRMLKFGEAYVDKGKEFYEEKYRHSKSVCLRKRLPNSVCNSYILRSLSSGFLESLRGTFSPAVPLVSRAAKRG